MLIPGAVVETARSDPVPVSETVCGEPLALSAIVNVPVRLPDAVGVKVTERLQLAPAATLAPAHVPVSAKSPEALIEVMVNVPGPEFVSFTDWAALVEPMLCEAKVRLAGESVTAGAPAPAAVPVPLKATVCGEPAALSVMVRVPVRAPLAAGVNVTEMVQLAPAATLDPQFWVSAKSPDAEMELIANAAEPEFVSVTVWAALLDPTGSELKFKLVADICTVGAAAVAVPTSAIFWVAPATLSELSVNVREPEIAPAVVGAKLTWYVQDPPGISSAPVDEVKRSRQVLALPMVNPAETDGLVPVAGITKVSGYIPTF
jgi:hypothetical protein